MDVLDGWNLKIKERHGNFITLEYNSTKKYTDTEILDLKNRLTDRLLSFDNETYRLEIDDKEILSGIVRVLFRIRNSGFYSNPKVIESVSKSENTSTEEKSLSDSDSTKKQTSKNVPTNSDQDQRIVPTKLKNVPTKNKKPNKTTRIAFRIDENTKLKINEKAKESGFTSTSKFILSVLSNSDQNQRIVPTKKENVPTKPNNKERALLLELLKTFVNQSIETDLPEDLIELAKKIIKEENLD